MTLYTNEFYDEMYERNKRVASEIMPILVQALKPKSIVDVGCGQGIFLHEAERNGIEVLGIDGEYVEKDKLLISNFLPFDLSKPLKYEKKFDLAISFEVAEHIPKESSDIFVDTLTGLSDVIAFSAAIPGQGGIGHVNEEWASYWVEKFKKKNYYSSNCLRKIFWNNDKITPLRRQNILLFVKNDRYKEVISCFETQNIWDIVHPETYRSEKGYIQNLISENELLKNRVSDFEYMKNCIRRDEEERSLQQLAKRKSRLPVWELINDIDNLEYYSQNETFRKNFSCYQLDNFELAYGNDKYILWGAGADGDKVYRLMKLLSKDIVCWCDKNIGGKRIIDGVQIQSIEDMYRCYRNEILFVATRKYMLDVMNEIVSSHVQLKRAIFNYDMLNAWSRHEKEYRKETVLSYPPLWMTIGVTSACSNQCLFCSYHGEDAKEISNTYGLPYMLSYEDFTRIVDMAKEGGVPELHICGTGEPFFNPDILKMIDYVIEKYGEVSLQTEFGKVLFDKNNYLDELIKREKHITYISTDVLSSIGEEHNHIKKGASYSELLETMEYIGKNSSLIVRVVIIITKENYKNIKGIIDDFLEREVNLELLIVNLLSYDYSDYTSSDNVYTSEDIEITKCLREVEVYAKERGVKVSVPKPADQEEDCYVFWREFQTWPVKGCAKERYGENMIPHACVAVVRGELNSIGYLFDYPTIMEAWNNEKLVKIRENMIKDNFPSQWCKRCFYYHKEDSIYR